MALKIRFWGNSEAPLLLCTLRGHRKEYSHEVDNAGSIFTQVLILFRKKLCHDANVLSAYDTTTNCGMHLG